MGVWGGLKKLGWGGAVTGKLGGGSWGSPACLSPAARPPHTVQPDPVPVLLPAPLCSQKPMPCLKLSDVHIRKSGGGGRLPPHENNVAQGRLFCPVLLEGGQVRIACPCLLLTPSHMPGNKAQTQTNISKCPKCEHKGKKLVCEMKCCPAPACSLQPHTSTKQACFTMCMLCMAQKCTQKECNGKCLSGNHQTMSQCPSPCPPKTHPSHKNKQNKNIYSLEGRSMVGKVCGEWSCLGACEKGGGGGVLGGEGGMQGGEGTGMQARKSATQRQQGDKVFGRYEFMGRLMVGGQQHHTVGKKARLG